MQASLIQLKQADPEQVFLAYLSAGGRTFYEVVKETKFKGLLGPKKERPCVVSSPSPAPRPS